MAFKKFYLTLSMTVFLLCHLSSAYAAKNNFFKLHIKHFLCCTTTKCLYEEPEEDTEYYAKIFSLTMAQAYRQGDVYFSNDEIKNLLLVSKDYHQVFNKFKKEINLRTCLFYQKNQKTLKKFFSKLELLESLTIKNDNATQLNNHQIILFADILQQLPHLKALTLDLKRVALSTQGATALAMALTSLTHLQNVTFYLNGAGIYRMDATALETIMHALPAKTHRDTYLSLEIPITAEIEPYLSTGLKNLERGLKASTLCTKLHLNWVFKTIDAAGASALAKALKELPYLSHLKFIKESGVYMGTAETQALSTVLHQTTLPALRHLVLKLTPYERYADNYTQLLISFASILKRLPKLITLDLNFTRNKFYFHYERYHQNIRRQALKEALQYLPHLKDLSLHLRHQYMYFSDYKAIITALNKLTHLTTFHLALHSEDNIRMWYIQDLANAFKSLPSFTSLTLSLKPGKLFRSPTEVKALIKNFEAFFFLANLTLDLSENVVDHLAIETLAETLKNWPGLLLSHTFTILRDRDEKIHRLELKRLQTAS